MFFELELSAYLLLAGLIAGELYFLAIRNRMTEVRIAYFALLVVVWLAGYYLFTMPAGLDEAYPGRVAAFLVVTFSITVAIFAVGLELATKLKPRWLPHLALTILSLAIALIWPSFTLMTSCVMVECF